MESFFYWKYFFYFKLLMELLAVTKKYFMVVFWIKSHWLIFSGFNSKMFSPHFHFLCRDSRFVFCSLSEHHSSRKRFPKCFRFSRHHGICIQKHKMFQNQVHRKPLDQPRLFQTIFPCLPFLMGTRNLQICEIQSCVVHVFFSCSSLTGTWNDRHTSSAAGSWK